MRQNLSSRLARLEEKHASLLIKPWVVLKPGQEPPEGWEASYGGIATWRIEEGRKPFPIYEGERLRETAWPNHLLVPMAGKRPEGEPLPYCLELIPELDNS